MGLRPAKSHEKLSGRRLADEILWGRLVTCGRLAIGPCRLRGGPAAVTNRRAGCQPVANLPHIGFSPQSPGMLYWAKKKRMEDIQQQLAALRQRIARVDRKYANPSAPPRPPLRPDGQFIEELLSGEVVTTPLGQHFETEKLWESHRRHGSVYISDLAELPEDLLHPLSAGAVSSAHPTRWAFLDTETTGLAGGTRTYAFLIGVGSIDSTGFRLRQFFMRDYGEEASLLYRLTEYLERFDVLITYNGKSYDQPLLETRFRMVRAHHPFDRMQHLDLLFGARRLWKLRLESCRLVDLENRILGV